MATIRVMHRFNASYVRTHIGPSAALRNHLQLRGLAVRTAAQQRLREPPRRIDTGLLINSIQILVYYQFGAPVVRIGTDVEYALFIHNGTRPHRIVPRNARVLAWQGPTGVVFARSVNHPGMAANPFLRDGLQRGMAQFR